MNIFITALLLLTITLGANAFTCMDLETVQESYSTRELVSGHRNAFIVTFSLSCAGKPVKGEQLNAVLADGRVLPVVTEEDGATYEVSWIVPHSNAPTGTVSIDLYDNASLKEFYEAQGDSIPTRQLSLTFDHTAAKSDNLPVQSSFIALVTFLAIFLAASSLKGKIEA